MIVYKISKSILGIAALLVLQTSVADSKINSQLGSSSRYVMTTKEEFFRGINDGRVWSLLSENKPQVCFNRGECFTNIFTQNNAEGLNQYLTSINQSPAKLLADDIYTILKNDYGLKANYFPSKNIDRDIQVQLKAIALIASKDDLNNSTLRDIYFQSLSSASYPDDFMKAYGNFIIDYSNKWSYYAPSAIKNAYFLPRKKQENNLEECRKSSNYKLYHVAQNAKDMDQSVKLNDMALQMASPYDRDTARIRGERNMAVSMRTYYFNEYKKLGGKATSVASINVPGNPCK